MTTVMKKAINQVMDMVKPWELSAVEQKNLRLAESGNEGALCDLLASLGMQGRKEFDSFYASITDDDVDAL